VAASLPYLSLPKVISAPEQSRRGPQTSLRKGCLLSKGLNCI
jgi:hypothetical protein